MVESFSNGRKHCGKRRNCLLRAISPFPPSVFKRLLLHTCEHQGLFGRGLILYQNNKILDWSKLKTFATDKINVNEQLKFGLGTVQNILRKC